MSLIYSASQNAVTTRGQFPALYPVAVIISVGILLTENIRLINGTAKNAQKYFLLLTAMLMLRFTIWILSSATFFWVKFSAIHFSALPDSKNTMDSHKIRSQVTCYALN